MGPAKKLPEVYLCEPTEMESYLEESADVCGFPLSPRREIDSPGLTGFYRKASADSGRDISSQIQYSRFHISGGANHAPRMETTYLARLTSVEDILLTQPVQTHVEEANLSMPHRFSAMVRRIDGRPDIRLSPRHFWRAFWYTFGVSPEDIGLTDYVKDGILDHEKVSQVIPRLARKVKRESLVPYPTPTFPTPDIVDGVREYIGMFMYDLWLASLP